MKNIHTSTLIKPTGEEGIMETASGERFEITELELKCCERCGALWLRERGTDEIYCMPCRLRVGKFGILRKPKRQLASAIRKQLRLESQGMVLAVVEEGGLS